MFVPRWRGRRSPMRLTMLRTVRPAAERASHSRGGEQVSGKPAPVIQPFYHTDCFASRIYAVDRAWVGPYRVSLDGSSTDFDGVARPFGDDDDSDGNFVLFAASDIPAAQHNVRITTTAVGGLVTSAPALGIDHVSQMSLRVFFDMALTT